MEDIDEDRWQSIKASLGAGHERWPGILGAGGPRQDWAHRLIGTVWLLAGADGLTFLESDLEERPGGGLSARIVALTSTRIIVIDAAIGSGDGNGTRSARAYPRRSVRSVEVLDLQGDPEAGERFPSGVRLLVRLEQHEGLELGTTPVGRSQLAAVYGSLLHDLD